MVESRSFVFYLLLELKDPSDLCVFNRKMVHFPHARIFLTAGADIITVVLMMGLLELTIHMKDVGTRRAYEKTIVIRSSIFAAVQEAHTFAQGPCETRVSKKEEPQTPHDGEEKKQLVSIIGSQYRARNKSTRPEEQTRTNNVRVETPRKSIERRARRPWKPINPFKVVFRYILIDKSKEFVDVQGTSSRKARILKWFQITMTRIRKLMA